MLYALEHPLSLVVLVTSFVVGVTLHGWVQSLVLDRSGDRSSRQTGRLKPDPRRHLDPFGAVAAALSGLGWGHPVDSGLRVAKRTVLLLSLAGPAVNLALGAGLLLARRAFYGPISGHVVGAAFVLQHGQPSAVADLGSLALLLGGASQLYLGALQLVPLPPLDGGRLLFAYVPRTLFWMRAEQALVERNLGLVAVLVLLLVPLGGSVPALPALLDIVLRPVLRLLIGG